MNARRAYFSVCSSTETDNLLNKPDKLCLGS